MHRMLYVFLRSWPIDRLRRNGLLPSAKPSALSDNCSATSNNAPSRQRPGPIPAMGPGRGLSSGHTKRGPVSRDDLEEGAFAAEELPFATVTAAGGKQLLAAVNPAAAEKGLVPGLPL